MEKDALFAYQLDWDVMDVGVIDTRVKPWVNSKIRELLGEQEDDVLVDFVCRKVSEQVTPT